MLSLKRLATFSAFAVAVLAATTTQAALVGLWTFENNLLDSAGTNHGTGFNSPTFVADVPAALPGSTRSLSFSGAAHVVIANEANFDFGNAMTVSTWVKGGLPGTWDPFISKNGEPNGWQLRRNGSNPLIDFTTRRSPNNDQTDFPSTNNAAGQVINNDPGNWHHIVGTFDGSIKRIYIDGVLNNQVAVAPGAIINSPDSVVFGGRQNPGPGVGNTSFEGQLDNVAIYSHALEPHQVAFLAAGGNPAALPAPVTDMIGVAGGFTVRDAASSVRGSIVNLAAADSLLAGNNLLSQTIALNVPRINYFDADGGGGVGNFGGDAAFPNNNNALQGSAGTGDANQGDQDFAIMATASLIVTQGGVYTFGHNTDDGGRLRINGVNVFNNDVLSGPHDFFGSINLAPGTYSLEYVYFERGGGAEGELFVALGAHTSFGPQFSLLTVSTFVAVPEPAVATLGLMAISALGLRRRRMA